METYTNAEVLLVASQAMIQQNPTKRRLQVAELLIDQAKLRPLDADPLDFEAFKVLVVLAQTGKLDALDDNNFDIAVNTFIRYLGIPDADLDTLGRRDETSKQAQQSRL